MSLRETNSGFKANAALASIMVSFRPKLNRALRDAYVAEGDPLNPVPDRAKVEAVVNAARNVAMLAEASLEYLEHYEAEGAEQ